ncbi:EYxxD motif small membrane protein [Bacillus sp. HMF5848]
MFWEYLTDMIFVYATLIGSIIAILYVYIRKRKNQTR